MLLGTLEGSYRYIKRVKENARKELNEEIEEAKRKERKAQRTRYGSAGYIPFKLHDLYVASQKVSEEKAKRSKVTFEQMEKLVDRLTNAGVFEALAEPFLGYAVSKSYSELDEKLKNSDAVAVNNAVKNLLVHFKNAMSEMNIGITRFLKDDIEYNQIYNDIQRRTVGVPTEIQNLITDYVDSANGINNLKFIDLPKLVKALGLESMSPIGTLMLQNIEQSADHFLSSKLDAIRSKTDLFLQGEGT